MKTDTVIRSEGMKILMVNLGLVEAERFVMLIQKESFDYTRWQENLFEELSLEEISQKAADFRKVKENTNDTAGKREIR
jgi:hypothetical protein